MKHSWDFVEAWYPNYAMCEEMANLNKMAIIADDNFEDADGGYEALLLAEKLSDQRRVDFNELRHTNWFGRELAELYNKAYRGAIDAFLLSEKKEREYQEWLEEYRKGQPDSCPHDEVAHDDYY